MKPSTINLNTQGDELRGSIRPLKCEAFTEAIEKDVMIRGKRHYVRMKKLIYILILTATCNSLLYAQTDQRTTTTKIADLLARVPAANADQLKASMEAMGDLGENGLEEMASMLSAPGKGDNTSLEYAIKSFSYYVTQPDKEAWRKWAVAAYGKALDKLAAGENKAFMITQLEITGKDDAVGLLQNYLKDEQLTDHAARALVRINTPAAGKALLDELKTASGNRRLTLLEALGDAQYREAVPAITALTNDGDPKTKKLAYYALAHTGDPASAGILKAAAEKSGYVYDITNATSSYLFYLNQLAQNGNGAAAGNAAQQLITKCTQDKQVHTRTAALAVLAKTKKEASLPQLLAAADDKNSEYREAALKYAGRLLNNTSANAWIKKAGTTGNKQSKAAIITMLGNSRVQAAAPAILSALKDPDPAVRLASISAAGKTGSPQALPALLSIMKTGKHEEVDAAKRAILSLKSDDIANRSAGAMESMPAYSKAALIEILAARGADNHFNEVLALTRNKDTTVSKAAYGALKGLSDTSSLPSLYPLLLSAEKADQIKPVQAAIVSAAGDIKDPDQRVNGLLAQLQQAPENKKYLFFPILAASGGKQALSVTAAAFEQGDAQTKTAVIEALSNWTDASAAGPLYQIAKQQAGNSYLDPALQGYTKLIARSAWPDDQKLLSYRKAMAIAQTSEQKQTLLEEVGRCKTLIALVFAGSFLDDPQLQQEAAKAVMSIALSGSSFYGDVVKQLLEKSIAVLQGQDSDYSKQAARKYLAEMPAGPGFVSMFNGKDLSGWKGLVADPIQRAKMSADTLSVKQQKADEIMKQGWSVKDGELVFSGHGDNLCTQKKYGDFEMYVDWKIARNGDAGIYLRGTPQVQIWDTSRTDVGAQVGSGGLYNNQRNISKPLKLADNAIGEWNTFHIIMKGETVTVYLNGELVVDNTVLENYWDRKLPIPPIEQIELQAHGNIVWYRDLYVREIERPKPFELSEEEKKEGFKILFDGSSLDEWVGNKTDYAIENGTIAVRPKNGGHGNLYTKDEYSDFVYRFEFQLTPGSNNGIGIRAPLEGDAAYAGMEIQVLDNEAPIYKNLHEYQYHGSVYGVIPAKRGFLKPLGEWNEEEITAVGNKIKVVLNGTTILDGDIAEASKNGTADGKDHPGLKNGKGHIGFLGHGDILGFRNVRIKDLSKPSK